MKNLKIVLAIMIFTVLTGCMSTNKLYKSAVVDHPGVVVTQHLEADIRVDDTKKIKGSSSSTYLLMFRLKGDSEYADGLNYNDAGMKSVSAGGLLKKFFSFINPLTIINTIISKEATSKVKGSAAYNALQGTGADLIAHPTYSITKKNYIIIQKFEATVEGYPGFYSNFRSYDKQKRELDYNLNHQVNRKIVEKLRILEDDVSFE